MLELSPPSGTERRSLAAPTFGPRIVCTSCGIIGADARPNWGDADRNAMAKLRQALNVLARHTDGCAEAVLIAGDFTIDRLSGLVIDGFATLERKEALIWMQISDAGRKAIAD